nr:MAG TPA: hypothetical protein [Caudoviricetes sp.]
MKRTCTANKHAGAHPPSRNAPTTEATIPSPTTTS